MKKFIADFEVEIIARQNKTIRYLKIILWFIILIFLIIFVK